MDFITSSYNLELLVLSFVVSVFGSFTALQLAIRIPMANRRALGFWVLAAGIALGGGGIWSMHFIGMLAMKTPFELQFDLAPTLLSFVIAVTFVSVGLVVAGRDLLGEASLILGGIIAGLGVSSMHYLGMYALRVPATISYDSLIVGLSIVIGVVASIVALWLAFNLRGVMQRFGSAILMGVAVCGMHYTGMYAATMKPDSNIIIPVTKSFSGFWLASTVSLITIALLVTILVLTSIKTRNARRLA